MTHWDVGELQRLLANEFESRGWELHPQTAHTIASTMRANPTAKAEAIARDVNLHSLARSAPRRRELVAAIERVKGRLARVDDHGDVGSLRILFVAAGPLDEARLRLDAEHREIRSRIRSSTSRDRVILE